MMAILYLVVYGEWGMGYEEWGMGNREWGRF